MQTLPLLPRSNSSRSGSWFQGEYWLWESVCGAAMVAPAPHRAGRCHCAREALAGTGQPECHSGAVGHEAAEDGAMRS